MRGLCKKKSRGWSVPRNDAGMIENRKIASLTPVRLARNGCFMRKIIVSIHSTFNGVVTGPADDKTNFMTMAQAGIEDSLEPFPKPLANVDTILLGRATYEDCPGLKQGE
jgi:hypothetical protein